MHKVLSRDGSIKRVTMTAEEWRKLHPDYKGSGNQMTALVLDAKCGTVLVPVQITADGLPVPPKRAALPFCFPDELIEQMREVSPARFKAREEAAEAILTTQYGDPEYEGTDAATQLAAFAILATEADALSDDE